MISVIAKIAVKPELIDNAMQEVKGLVAKVAEEEGTLMYTVNIDKNSPNTLVFMERYKDTDSLKAHGATPHFNEFMGKAMEFAAGEPEITVMKEVLSA